MCAKKRSTQYRTWKLAGEPLRYPSLSAAEQKQIKQEFLTYQPILGSDFYGVTCVSQDQARLHESAAQAVAALLCVHYEGRFEREDVIKAVAATAALPGDLVTGNSRKPSFLLGAALWMLDYLDDACEDPDDYLTLLPEEIDEEVNSLLPLAEDLNHSWKTITRMVMVLYGRRKTYRKEFRTLLGLIEKEERQALRDTFKASFLDYMDRLLAIYRILKPAKPNALNVPLVSDRGRTILDHLAKPVYQTAQSEVFHMIVINDLICRPVTEIQKWFHSRKASELLAGYGTDDPYALCAAYLILDWEGDVLANLNTLTAIVNACAMRHLPWYQDDLGVRMGLLEAGVPDYRMRYEYRNSFDEEDEVPLESGRRLSEVQLFYLATGVVLPRDRKPSDELALWFAQQGVDERRAGELAWAAFMAYYIDEAESDWAEPELFDDEGEDHTCSEEPECAEETPAAVLPDETASSERLEKLNRQLKELQGALHDAERTSNRLREQLLECEHQAEVDKAELAQLRDTLYRLRSGESETDVDSGPVVELPWQVKRQVVAFGGHDSWLKAVKPLLPGARFYGREILPDLNAIRSADVVWIQPNALSHKYYYRIIDAARKGGVPVRYFGSASAKKCAVQLALDELAAHK